MSSTQSASNTLGTASDRPFSRTGGDNWNSSNLLETTVSDLRMNNRDLRLILGYLERDTASLRRDLESEVAKNTGLEERVQVLRDRVLALQRRNDELEDVLALHCDNSVVCIWISFFLRKVFF